jgi:hypothetical protein
LTVGGWHGGRVEEEEREVKKRDGEEFTAEIMEGAEGA